MFIAILGRQPKIGTAEIEAVYGANAVTELADDILEVETDFLDISHLGGTKKAGLVFARTPRDQNAILSAILKHLTELNVDGKTTLGLSAYHLPFTAANLQKIGMRLKVELKKQGKSLRLVPNSEPALSTATSHHNKLGLSPNKIEIFLIGQKGKVVLATSTGAQNITAYAARDQKRPKRDAFVGMLPPKLAQIIVNLAVQQTVSERTKIRVLDPFCGTGVVLQEALLMGHCVYGTDLNPKMIDYSRENLNWLLAGPVARSAPKNFCHTEVDKTFLGAAPPRATRSSSFNLDVGDATKFKWQKPIGAVASEVYLGQPFSAPPSDAKLAEVRRICRAITVEFLTNLAPQIKSGTLVCLAVPAWRTKYGFTRLDILDTISKLGYNIQQFKHATQQDLLYCRDSQVVGRELLVLKRS
ncbi:MAG: hypothetical protein LBH36_02135 [Candidatus Nomurabacteria bacterium]|nr:hypothetical protein [Candidatus Nomurabacteria bacterium]